MSTTENLDPDVDATFPASLDELSQRYGVRGRVVVDRNAHSANREELNGVLGRGRDGSSRLCTLAGQNLVRADEA